MPPMTPPTIFFEEEDRPELPVEPSSFPLSPGAPDAEADAAAMTLLVVWTLLRVLLPLTDITVVSNRWVTMPVRLDTVDEAPVVCVETVGFVELLDPVVVRTCDDASLTVEAAGVCEGLRDVVAVLSFEEGALVEVMIAALTEEGKDTVAGVEEGGTDPGADVGAADVDEALVKAPVPTGMFWR